MKLSEKVTKKNWIKGEFGDGDSHCLVGHILTSPKPGLILIAPLHDAIRFLYPERVIEGRILVAFNDHPDTTFEDVQRVLKFADV